MLARRTCRGPSSLEQRRKLSEKAKAQHASRRGYEVPPDKWRLYDYYIQLRARGDKSWTYERIGKAIGVLTVVLFFILPAAAHHAPSGWEYPGECCGKGDCFQLTNPQQDIKWTPDGWLITETNETIPFEQARVSGDDHWHRCFYPEWQFNSRDQPEKVMKRRTRSANHKKCLYVPAPEN